MRFLILSDGTIKQANSDILVNELIKRGARELKLKQINTPQIIDNNESRRSTGVDEIPKSRPSRKRRRSQGEVPRELD
ncbi:MAG: hypothetical protein ACK5QC_13675 [Bacteroidota bacterium]